MYYSQCSRALLHVHTYKHDSVTNIAYGIIVMPSKEYNNKLNIKYAKEAELTNQGIVHTSTSTRTVYFNQINQLIVKGNERYRFKIVLTLK